MKNLKISKNINVLAVAGIILVSGGAGAGIAVATSDIVNNDKPSFVDDITSKITNYSEVNDSDLVPLEEMRPDIENRRLYVEKLVVTDVTEADDGLKFEIDNVLLTREEVKEYIGEVNYSKHVTYILYKDNGSGSYERIVTDNINIEGPYYVDPNNFIELVDPEQGYCFNGKIRKKE